MKSLALTRKSKGLMKMLLAFLAVFPLVAIVPVVLIGLLIWGAWNPLVWRVLSVLGMATGAGFLVWGILMAAMKEECALCYACWHHWHWRGVLVGSIALLVISFCGGCKGHNA